MLISAYYGSIAAGFGTPGQGSPWSDGTFWSDGTGWTDG
jgi:hypothetical protein